MHATCKKFMQKFSTRVVVVCLKCYGLTANTVPRSKREQTTPFSNNQYTHWHRSSRCCVMIILRVIRRTTGVYSPLLYRVYKEQLWEKGSSFLVSLQKRPSLHYPESLHDGHAAFQPSSVYQNAKNC